MKTKFFLLTALIFFSTYLFSQIKTVKPFTQKTEVTTPLTTKTAACKHCNIRKSGNVSNNETTNVAACKNYKYAAK